METCPACRSEKTALRWTGLPDRLFQTTDSTFDLRSCQSCRTHFLSPIPQPDELSHFYPKSYWVGPPDSGTGRSTVGDATERYRRWVLRDHVRFVRSIIQQQRVGGMPGNVLDVGCGDGSFLEALAVEAAMGMDISSSAVESTLARGFQAVLGTPQDAPIAPASFSLVTAFHFLEHVVDVDATLSAMRNLISPGGALVVQVPNLDSWQAKLLGRRWAGLDIPRHTVDFSHAGLLTALQRCGFEVIAENHFCLRDNPTTIVNSLAPAIYPPARLTRGKTPTGLRPLLANLAYLASTLACWPFAFIESTFSRGASVMVHAVPRYSGEG